MKRISGAIFALSCTITMAFAADGAPVEYDVSFENAAHREAEITVRFRDIGDEPLVLQMARSSPGRYALHEFAKNVYDVRAVDSEGAPLTVNRTNPYSWHIDNHDGDVTVTYTLYADHGDGTYSQIDLTHAHLNMPATFIWAEGLEDRPIDIRFKPADRDWRVATQLERGRGLYAFRAPNLQYFLDSPTELSAFELSEWRIGEGDPRQTIRLAIHHDGTKEDLEAYTEKAKKIVAEQIEIFGEAPQFDYGEYTFIADYLPHITGDGMEHRNSTILARSQSLYEGEFAHISTLSHEFFHAWNVERIRPAELEPFEFTNANPTPSLWFAEGFTNYYGDLAIRRADEFTLDEYLEQLSGALNYVISSPGRRYASPQEMSLQAPFVDAARSVDPTNRVNTFISYYTYGEVLALALDLTIRQKFEGRSLDDMMRYMWINYGKPEKPYTHDDLKDALAEVTGDANFAADFFGRYIENSDLPDYEALFKQAGLELKQANPEDAYLGRVSFEENGDALMVASNTILDTPLYNAGIDRGDEILRVGRFKIDDEKDWERALSRHAPGDMATIKFNRRGVGEIEAKIQFVADPTLEVVSVESDDVALTDDQITFRKAWLGETSVADADDDQAD